MSNIFHYIAKKAVPWNGARAVLHFLSGRDISPIYANGLATRCRSAPKLSLPTLQKRSEPTMLLI